MNRIPLNLTMIGYGTFALDLPTQQPVSELKAVMRKKIKQLEGREFEFYSKGRALRLDQTLEDADMLPHDTLEIKIRPN